MTGTLIANTMILDGSGAPPFPGDVLVEGRRIVTVQGGGGLPRGSARVIDGAGSTLMPGLIEPHGHVSYPDAARNSDFTRLPPEEHVLATMRNARTLLDCGYTSVLSAASAKPRLDIVIRNEIEAGRIAGPRYLANGPAVTVTGGVGIIYPANFADEEALALLEANRDWCFVAPAVGLTYQACHAASEWGFTPQMARDHGLLDELEVSVDTMGRMRKRGIRVLPGGDYGFAWNPHGPYARDLLLFLDLLCS